MQIKPIYDRSLSIVNAVERCDGDADHRVRPGGAGDLLFLGRATDTLIPVVALPLSLLLTFIAMTCWVTASTTSR